MRLKRRYQSPKFPQGDDLESFIKEPFIKGGGWKGSTLSKPLPSFFIGGELKGEVEQGISPEALGFI